MIAEGPPADGWWEPDSLALVRMRDGARLATDVYLPRPLRGRVPAVLMRGPYGRRGEINALPALAPILADRGWALVAQDVRGKWDSEGDRRPFEGEVADGDDTVAWISAQTWSDGRVVVMGESYLGFTAWAAAASGNPAVIGAIVRVTSTRPVAEWIHRNGVLRPDFAIEWAANWWAHREVGDFVPDWRLRPLAAVARNGPDGTAELVERWASLSRGREGAPGPCAAVHLGELPEGALASIRVPVLHVGGWYDAFLVGQLRDWHRWGGAGPTGDPRHAPHRLTIDATDHTFNLVVPRHDRPPDLLADVAARIALLPRQHVDDLEFLDALRAGTLPSAPPVHWHLVNDDWQRSTSWPPPDTRPLVLYPADVAAAHLGPEGGVLATRPELTPAAVRWVHDPADPVPTREGEWFRPLFARADASVNETRPDVVTFTSPPMTRPLDLVGPTVLHAAATGPGEAVPLVVRLVDVHPDGFGQQISAAPALVPNAEPTGPGDVPLGEVGYRLLPGHRLRLEVAASSYPRYAIHDPHGRDPWHGTPGGAAEVSLRVGPGGSWLALSVRSA